MSVSKSGGGINPAAGAAAPTPTGPNPGTQLDHLDVQVEEHLGRLGEGWRVPDVVAWQGEFLALLARYAYPGGVAPQPLVTGYLTRFRAALRERGYAAETVPAYLRQFRELAAPGRVTAGAAAVGPAYMAVTGNGPNDPPDPAEWGLFRIDRDTPVRLTNFVLAIDEEVTVADEAAPERRMVGRVVMGGVERPLTVTTAEYASNEGLKAAVYGSFGVAAQVFCRPDDLRNAVAAVSTPTATTVTTNFGWTADASAFLVPSGGITAAGFRAAEPGDPVRLDLADEEHTRHLDLRPLPADELARVKAHIRDDLLHVHDPAVMRLILAAVGLAVLQPHARDVSRFALWLTGLTGSGKTFLARLARNFFGTWGQQHPLPSFASTANYLERQGYFFRNAVYVIDDYKPNVTHTSQIVRLLQAYADSGSRGRLRVDATANASRPIRGLLVVTGEDTIEHTPSAIARAVVVPVRTRHKDIERGARCAAESTKYAGVTADFVRWLLAHDGLARFARRVEELKGRYYRDIAGQQNDARIAGNFAQLAAAGELMFEYFRDVIPDADAITREFVEADLTAMRDAAVSHVREEQESNTFLRVLADLLTTGRVRVQTNAGRGGQSQDHSPVVGVSVPARPPRGTDRGRAAHLRLSARTCLEHVNQALERQGAGKLKVTEKALLNQLRHDALLLDEAGEPLPPDGPATRAVRVAGSPIHCFLMSAATLLGDESGDGSAVWPR